MSSTAIRPTPKALEQANALREVLRRRLPGLLGEIKAAKVSQADFPRCQREWALFCHQVEDVPFSELPVWRKLEIREEDLLRVAEAVGLDPDVTPDGCSCKTLTQACPNDRGEDVPMRAVLRLVGGEE